MLNWPLPCSLKIQHARRCGATDCENYTFMHPIKNILSNLEVSKGTKVQTMSLYWYIKFNTLATRDTSRHTYINLLFYSSWLFHKYDNSAHNLQCWVTFVWLKWNNTTYFKVSCVLCYTTSWTHNRFFTFFSPSWFFLFYMFKLLQQ